MKSGKIGSKMIKLLPYMLNGITFNSLALQANICFCLWFQIK